MYEFNNIANIESLSNKIIYN